MRAVYALALISACAFTWGCSQPDADPYLNAPTQANIPAYAADSRGLKKVASFEAKVFILARKDYDLFLKDRLSDYAPVDLAVAWGQAARRDVRQQVRVWQRDRYFFWHADRQAWQDERVRGFGEQSANWHIIPADKSVSHALGSVDEGAVVSMRGYLVDIEPPGGGPGWKTSRTRTDKGGGACEIFLVTQLQETAG